MRERKKKWAAPYLATSPYVVQEGQENAVNQLVFEKQTFLEIGTGKGDFIVTMANRHPDCAYIGLELQPSIMALAVKKASDLALNNILFFLANADRVDLLFEKNSIATIYLNFSDPWPKARHAKRRLTSPSFLTKYHYILKENGLIYLKTDNQNLFEYTLEMLGNSKFELVEKQEDYQLLENDVATEYEQRFRALGQAIYRIVLRKKDEKCV